MAQRFLLDVAPTGVQHLVEINHDGDELTLIEHTPTLVENEILQENARLRGMAQRKGNFALAAKVDINTWTAWKKEWRTIYRGDMTWPQFEVMKLNSRDNCNLRVGYQRSAFGKKL